MTTATVTGSQGVFWRPSAPAAPPLRVAHQLRSQNRLAAIMLAAICAFALLLATAPTATSHSLFGTETRVAAQTSTGHTFVGAEASGSPTAAGPNGLYGYDGSLGCCVAPTSALDETAQLALPSGRFTNGSFAPGQLESHYLKHADEYGAIGIDAYLARARSLLSTDVGNGIRGFTRSNGDVVRFNIITGEFAAGAADGTIRTLFRPDDGLAYFLQQVP